MLDKLRVWTTSMVFMRSQGPQLLPACKVLSRGIMISSALVPVFVTEAPFEYRLSLGAFTLSFLVFQCIYWRDVVHNLIISLIVVILPLAALYPFPGIPMTFVVLRIPLLLALLSVIAVQIGHITRINNQEAALTQPLRRRISTWLSECDWSVLKDIQGGPGTVKCSKHSSDMSLPSDPLPSPPSEWDSTTRRWFLPDRMSPEASTRGEAGQL